MIQEMPGIFYSSSHIIPLSAKLIHHWLRISLLGGQSSHPLIDCSDACQSMSHPRSEPSGALFPNLGEEIKEKSITDLGASIVVRIKVRDGTNCPSSRACVNFPFLFLSSFLLISCPPRARQQDIPQAATQDEMSVRITYLSRSLRFSHSTLFSLTPRVSRPCTTHTDTNPSSTVRPLSLPTLVSPLSLTPSLFNLHC